MLFARKVILVEGIAENLLMSTLARYDGKSLEDQHVAVVNINGRYFNHFVKLFNTESSPNAIPKKVACITDRDPVRKKKEANCKFTVCYPFDLYKDNEHYEYSVNAEEEEKHLGSIHLSGIFHKMKIKVKHLNTNLLCVIQILNCWLRNLCRINPR